MIEHIVVFELSKETTQEQIEALYREISSFRDRIPGILDLTIGENFSKISKNYTHGVVIRFETKQALKDYFTNPIHTAMVENHLKPILVDGLEIDYEIVE